jgi:lipopolysaccharide transport system ATP-binding protein
METPAIIIENLTKTYRIPHERKTTLFEHLTSGFKTSYTTFTALKNINLTIQRGEAIGIIGDNGSGKSTLLKLVAGIIKPTSGRVTVNGRITPMLEIGVGFQPELTARENIHTYATLIGLTQSEVKKLTPQILNYAELEEFEDVKLKNFSSGMQARLAFATAIHTTPDILLIDEVLAVGDLEFQQKCHDTLQKFRKQGVTILLVSHDLTAIRRLCSKTLLLQQGKQIAYDDTNHVIDTYIYHAEREETPETEKTCGTKEVEITKVELLDKYHKKNHTFTTGDPLTIKIHYHAKHTVQQPIFGIAIYTDNNTHCFGTNTKIQKIEIPQIKGRGVMSIHISKLPLLQGKYLLTTAIHDVKKTYDWHDKRYPFNVVTTTQSEGLVHLECTFKLEENNTFAVD